LFDERDPYAGPAGFRAALAKLRESPAEVPRTRRFLHAAAVGAAAVLMVAIAIAIPVFAMPMVASFHSVATELAAENLENLARRDLAVGLVMQGPAPLGMIAPVAQYSHDIQTVEQLQELQDGNRRFLEERDKWTIGFLRQDHLKKRRTGVRSTWA